MLKKFFVLFIVCISVAHGYPQKRIVRMILAKERKYNIPQYLLLSIAQHESGLNPYALNIAGKSCLPQSKYEAMKIIKSNLKAGITSIDIGLMQINYNFHSTNFRSIRHMLCIHYNIDYAAYFLRSLFDKYKSWDKAVKHYHSANSNINQPYFKKVLLTWKNKTSAYSMYNE